MRENDTHQPQGHPHITDNPYLYHRLRASQILARNISGGGSYPNPKPHACHTAARRAYLDPFSHSLQPDRDNQL